MRFLLVIEKAHPNEFGDNFHPVDAVVQLVDESAVSRPQKVLITRSSKNSSFYSINFSLAHWASGATQAGQLSAFSE